MNQKILRPAFRQLKGRPDLVGVEIGVYEGINAKHCLNKLDIKYVFLIDPYMQYEKYAPKRLGSKINLERAERAAHTILNGYGHKVRWIKKKSAEAIGAFTDDNLDFVYIDGNHAYDFVGEDILLYYPKLKVGGLLAGHDYDIKSVRKAVDEFGKINGLKVYAEKTNEGPVLLNKNKWIAEKHDWWIWKIDDAIT